MSDEIIVIDKIENAEYGGKPYKKVTDKAGKVFSIKHGQGGKLEAKWPLLQEGKAIKLHLGTYKDKPFVEDFELVENIFEQKAAEKVAVTSRTDERASIESQTAVKASVELMVAKIIGLDHPISQGVIAWCLQRLPVPLIDRGTEPKPSPASPESTPEPPKEETELHPPTDGGIDIVWLKESLTKISWHKNGYFSAKAWLKSKEFISQTIGTLEEVIANLTPEQKQIFVAKVQKRLDLI